MIFDAQKLKVNGSVDFKKRHNEFENIYLISHHQLKKKKTSHTKDISTRSREHVENTRLLQDETDKPVLNMLQLIGTGYDSMNVYSLWQIFRAYQ